VYTSYFGLKENPFNITPDPRFLFLSPYHKEALDHLLYGINERKGFIAITGGIGTGKTTLCRALLSHLDASTKTALIFNPFITDAELLKTITREFGIDVGPVTGGKKEYVDALNDFLLNNFMGGGNAVLLMDEAQNLSHEALEQIRILSNLETDREKLIQIVLMGQPELKALLSQPSLTQLDERITVRYHLGHLSLKDIKGYVGHRLVVAGARGDLCFTDGAYKKTYAYSDGNPRRINAVCDRALLIAYVRETHTISKGVVREAVKELQRNRESDLRVPGGARRGFAWVSVVLIAAFITAGLAGWTVKDYLLGFVANRKSEAVDQRPTVFPIPPRPDDPVSGLFLDEKTSREALFGMFRGEEDDAPADADSVPLGLVSFNLGPEYCALFKRPFRVRVSDSSNTASSSPSYLLICEVKGDAAVALDDQKRERVLTRQFMLKHWGHEVSWPYPYRKEEAPLIPNMRGPEVLKVQRILNTLGYLLEPTGEYDEPTFHEVLRFQEDLGLPADGKVDLLTRALLDQMTERHELHS
jgi:type II secretory pathway predicted ATPase ExeA